MTRRRRLLLAVSLAVGSSTWVCPPADAQPAPTPEQVAQQLPPPLPPPTPEAAAQADQRQGAYAEINGARIFYQIAGTGTPLLLIHGYPLSGQLFQFQLEGLSDQFQVIAPDLRGFGKSEAPNAIASTATYARDMLGLMDQLGIRTAIIGGHSMGGQVAMEMYNQAPERFAGMVLIGTNPMAASLVEQGQWRGYRRQGEAVGVPSIVPIAEPQLLTGATRAFDSARSATMMNILAEASLNGILGGGHALAARPDYTGLLGAIAVPTLVLVGLEDPVYAFPISQMTQAAIPRAALAVVPGASHAVVFERPEAANEAIRTWASSR